MQKMIIGLAGQKGAGKGLFVAFLTAAAEKRNFTVKVIKSSEMEESSAVIVIFDGVRWLSDVQMIKNFSGGKLVFIDAKKIIRYKRIRNRGEKPEEKNLSFGQFEAEEDALTENFIPQIQGIADFVIENNGSKKAFQEEVESFFKNQISGN